LNQNHLGGHCNITHVDYGSLALLKQRLDIKSVLDIGCGPGGMKEMCELIGVSWTGVDGDQSCSKENVITHDFTKGPLMTHHRDLVWSIEFVEHVDEQHVPNILAAFKLAKKAICMTHALPGKKGFHHVNCQPSEYWIDKIKSCGYELDIELTQQIRENSTMRREFMRNTGMVFTKI
jgi:cyclopropane fatty-acyl-phospholipid synthase-like methyltransferase